MKNGKNWHFFLVTLSLASTLAAVKLSDRRVSQNLAKPLDEIPAVIAGWSGNDNPRLEGDVKAILKPSSYLSRTYRKGSDFLDLFVAYYSHQRTGESMHSPKNCLPGSGWEVLETGTIELSVSGEKVNVNKYVVRNGLKQLLVLYWYQGKDRLFASEYYGKICLVWDALTKGRTAGSIVRLTVPHNKESLEVGLSFAAELIPELQKCFGRRD